MFDFSLTVFSAGYVVAKLNHLHWPEEGASQFAFRSTLIDLKDPSPVGSKIDYQDLVNITLWFHKIA